MSPGPGLNYGAFDLEPVDVGVYRTTDGRFAIRQHGGYDWRLAARDADDVVELTRRAPTVFTTLAAAAGWLSDHYPEARP